MGTWRSHRPTFSWRLLRSLRASPPGRAARGERRETFGAALEQSEQLFLAAGQVGVQSRPLLVFYGLSQAGRAIAAASTAAGNDDWRLSGHGIRVLGLQGPQRPVAGVTVRDEPGKGAAFTTMCRLLGAGSLTEPVPLGELWPLIPDVARFPLPGATGLAPLAVSPHPPVLTGDALRVDVGPLPASLAAPPVPGETDWQVGDRDWPGERQALRDHLVDYPGLTGFGLVSPDGNPVGFVADGPVHVRAPLVLRPSDGEHTPGDWLRSRTFESRGELMAFPSLRRGDPPQHPLMVWWAVTHALSMLARYEPRRWAHAVSPDSSGDAVALEHLLAEALVSLPELIHRTLMRATI
jgi:hypothetical protein